MKVADVVAALEEIAPPHLAAHWDNTGLLIGDAQNSATKLLLCIDLTAEVLAEARSRRATMVMCYHPVIFKPISRLTASSAPVAYAAAAAGISVYSVHTAFDAAPDGANDVLADALALGERSALEPCLNKSQCKIVAFVRAEDMSNVANAAFAAGAGRVGNYERCAFFVHGVGTFLSGPHSNPTIGVPGRQEATEEMRLEIIAPVSVSAEVCAAVRAVHSYEEPVIDVYPIESYPAHCGMGRAGSLERPISVTALVNRIKRNLNLAKVQIAKPPSGVGPISTAACCAGAGGSLWKAARQAGAQLYLTGEMRHHDALAAAAAGMVVVCTGHSNSERLSLARLAGRLQQSLPKLDVFVAKADKDPFEII